MTVETGARIVEGRQIPAAGVWQIDRVHSSIEFVVRHLMVSKVRGRFADYSGTIQVADVPEQSSVEVTIQAASIDTREPQRDAHLRSPDFLDAERFPTLTFRSRSLEPLGGEQFRVHGDLTIRGVTRPVVLDAEFLGVTADPWGGLRAGFSATADIDREDYGLTWNQALETGGVLVGKKARIEIEVEAVRQ